MFVVNPLPFVSLFLLFLMALEKWMLWRLGLAIQAFSHHTWKPLIVQCLPWFISMVDVCHGSRLLLLVCIDLKPAFCAILAARASVQSLVCEARCELQSCQVPLL